MWPALGFAFLACVPQDENELRALQVERSIESEIVDSDPAVHTATLDLDGANGKTVGRSWKVRVATSGRYWIELRSDSFDAYLVLRDASGKILAEDDDSGIASHARIVTELESEQGYRVDACALHGERGAFELELRAGEPPVLGDTEEAAREVEALERTLAIREEKLGPEHPSLADRLDRLGSLLYSLGEFGRAKPYLVRAVAMREKALGPEHPGTAESLDLLGVVLEALGDYPAARTTLERALAIRERVLGPKTKEVATSLNNLAIVLQDFGESDLARQCYARALEICDSTLGPDSPGTASCLSNFANLCTDQGDFAAARPLCERALAICEKVLGPDHPDTAASLVNLGNLLRAQLDLAGARRCFERAVAIYEKVFGPDQLDTGLSLHLLGLVLQSQGDYGAARSCFERALSICERELGPDHPSTSACVANLGMVLQLEGRLSDAEAYFARALEASERILGPEHPHTATILNNLGVLLCQEGRYEDAKADYARALAIREKQFGPAHPQTARSLNNLGSLLHDLGDFEGARDCYEKALASFESSLGIENVDAVSSLQNLAILHLDSGDAPRALACARRMFGASRNFELALLGTLSERECYSYLALAHWSLELFETVAARSGNAIEAYDALLSWKGQVARTLLAGRERAAANLDAEERAHVEELRKVQARLSALAFGAELGDAGARERELSLVRERKNALEVELARSLGVALPPPPSFAGSRAHLRPREALVDFFVHRDYLPASVEHEKIVEQGKWSEPRLSAWITGAERDEPVRIELGPTEPLELATREYLEQISGLGEAQAARGVAATATVPRRASSSSVRDRLWAPLAPYLAGVERVFVSPDGFLATLPFEVIALEDRSYLLEHYVFVYLQSADTLARAPSPGSVRESLLAVGGIDYDSGEAIADGDAAAGAIPSVVSAGSSALRGSFGNSWQALPFTRNESADVSDLFRASSANASRVLLQGRDATEERLKQELSRASIVHLATHGFFQPEGVPSLWTAALAESESRGPRTSEATEELAGQAPGLLCGLICAGANAAAQEGHEDGYLTAEEVSWLDLSKVELVVLSACETALGRAQSGEGLLGLRRAFEIAGAKTVISSLWSVKDESTARLMQSFYANLWQRKMGRADALRAAQLEMLAKNRAELHDALPSTWGAFVLSGEWR